MVQHRERRLEQNVQRRNRLETQQAIPKHESLYELICISGKMQRESQINLQMDMQQNLPGRLLTCLRRGVAPLLTQNGAGYDSDLLPSSLKLPSSPEAPPVCQIPGRMRLRSLCHIVSAFFDQSA